MIQINTHPVVWSVYNFHRLNGMAKCDIESGGSPITGFTVHLLLRDLYEREQNDRGELCCLQ